MNKAQLKTNNALKTIQCESIRKRIDLAQTKMYSSFYTFNAKDSTGNLDYKKIVTMHVINITKGRLLQNDGANFSTFDKVLHESSNIEIQRMFPCASLHSFSAVSPISPWAH